jgi:hypothetical protein
MESARYRRKPQSSAVSRFAVSALEAGLKAVLLRRGGVLMVSQYQHHLSQAKSSALVVLGAGALSAAANVAKHKWWSA